MIIDFSILSIGIIVDIYVLVTKNEIDLDSSLMRFGERVTSIICF